MKISFFKKLFSPPDYLSLPAAGIEICNRSIKYIEFFNKKGVFSIKNFGEVYLAPNVVKDGSVLNKNAFRKALAEVKKNILSDFVKVSIPEEKAYIFEVKIPREAKPNIREALEFKIEENVPLKLEESFFEYEIVDEDESKKDMTLNVSVVSRRIIYDYAETFEQAGIYPTSFEIESKVIANSVIPKGDKKNTIIVNIKDDSTVFIAVIDGFVRLTSSVTIGESAIRNNLLKSGLFSDELVNGKFFENDFSFETTYTKESYLSLINVFSVLKDEVEKFNGYIISKFPGVKFSSTNNIDRIILCGRSAVLPGISKHINQKIEAEVILANTWSNVFDTKEYPSVIKFNDSLSFVTSVGLAI